MRMIFAQTAPARRRPGARSGLVCSRQSARSEALAWYREEHGTSFAASSITTATPACAGVLRGALRRRAGRFVSGSTISRRSNACSRVLPTAAIQSVAGIEIRALRDELLATAPAQVVIEAFGCGLPETYAAAMAHARPASLWIVLEYLSAESWVREHHGLPSPHPRLTLQRYFFFPGFDEGTGGVLREPDLFARRDAFAEAGQRMFWTTAGQPCRRRTRRPFRCSLMKPRR